MIEIKNLNKSFGDKEILKNFNLSIKEGERLAIFGKSGIGKSTLLKIIEGLCPYDSGEIIFAKPPIFKTVFQENILFEDMSLYENILAVGEFSRKQVLEHLKALDMEGEIDRPVREISGGMKRRLAIIRAIIFPGNIFVMDEGLREVDEKTKAFIIEYINDNTKNLTVIFTSHNRDDIKALRADRVLELGG
ncbi:ATP-binding cassette domain-containing protein [Peptoniphilus sp. GNH]|nr:ATP-binding cassette domain-containing protein [Peptoniphilus sp. GNH]